MLKSSGVMRTVLVPVAPEAVLGGEVDVAAVDRGDNVGPYRERGSAKVDSVERFPDPSGVPLSKKLTVPVGVPLVVEATVAVTVTFKSKAMVVVLRVVVVAVARLSDGQRSVLHYLGVIARLVPVTAGMMGYLPTVEAVVAEVANVSVRCRRIAPVTLPVKMGFAVP